LKGASVSIHVLVCQLVYQLSNLQKLDLDEFSYFLTSFPMDNVLITLEILQKCLSTFSGHSTSPDYLIMILHSKEFCAVVVFLDIICHFVFI
jgi:hypothetical protein